MLSLVAASAGPTGLITGQNFFACVCAPDAIAWARAAAGEGSVADLQQSRNLTKGQQAMALAMIYPESERGRGKKDDARKAAASAAFLVDD